jgi:hypothetical protein
VTVVTRYKRKNPTIIFGSSRGNRGNSRNTSVFISRNSSIPVFTTLRVFVGTILI